MLQLVILFACTVKAETQIQEYNLNAESFLQFSQV